MQIIANNRVHALAKLGVDMHEDDVEHRMLCVSDGRRYTEVLLYMTRCLANSIDQGLYQEIQGQKLARACSSECRFVLGSLDQKHFFTFLTLAASKLLCVKCFSPASNFSRQASCPGDVWAKGHCMARLGHDILLRIRCGAYSVGRV